MRELLLATTNKGKAIEIAEVVKGFSLGVLTLSDAVARLGKDLPDVHESGTTYEANALLKARHYHALTGLPTLADDSGIMVEALKDELGVYTRRWGAGAKASDQEWIEYFLERMSRENNKRARFVCVLAYIDADDKEHLFEGDCDGVITDKLEADYLPGLPISACFKPDGYEKVYSALTIEQKNSTSHRGRALEKFGEYLESVLSMPRSERP